MHMKPPRIDERTWQMLTVAARLVRAHAHAPYSNFRVGAAILTKSGGTYVGCNVENATYGATQCAERNAIASMVAAGDRHPIACVVVTSAPRAAAPCGICRQVLAEFADDMPIRLVREAKSQLTHRTVHLKKILPEMFRLHPHK